jgi:GTP cyclohydrolase II
LGQPRRVDQEKTRTLIRLHTNGVISYKEFRGERLLNEAAKRDLRDLVSHARAGFEKEARDISTGPAMLSSLEIIWDEIGQPSRSIGSNRRVDLLFLALK